MKLTKNIIKGFITSIFGIATIIITLFLVFTEAMDFMWQGAVGIVLGTALLLSPDSIVKALGKLISITNNKRNDGDDPITVEKAKKDDSN